MSNIRVCKKSISYLVVCLIFLAAIPLIISAGPILITHDGAEHCATLSDEDVEITSYGGHFIKKNNPFNYTNGLYTEFIYHGDGSIRINVSFQLRVLNNPLRTNL